MEGNVVKKAVILSAASAASARPPKKRAFRSVLDYETEEELRHALNYCNVSSVLGASAVAGAVASTVAAAPVAAAAAEARCGVNFNSNNNSNDNNNNNNKATDWLLSVPDDEAEAQDVETEVQRLLNLRSYRALDDDDDQNIEHGSNNDDSDALLSTVFSETQRAHEREKFDALCREACLAYQVPVSTVSLVDLGRQYAFSSHGLPPNMPRSVSRQVAFCAHAILKKHKTGITVVKDTLQDARFQNNILVTQAPHLRFYAGAPLQSPEGYNLGTFCVEGPEPKPEGLSRDQQANLRDYAKRVVDLLVLRRRTLLERLVSATNHASSMCTDGSESSLLLRHAGVTTNLGGLLHYYQYSSNNNAQVHNSSSDENDDNNISFAASGGGSCVTAMHLFQESVQTLMLLQDNDSSAAADAKNDTTTFTAAVATPSSSVSPASDNKPSKGRLQEMLQLWTLLSAANNAKPSRKTFFQTFRRLFPPISITYTTTTATTTTANTASSSTSITTSSSTIPESTATAASTIQLCPHHASIVGGIPGLFSRSSKLKGSMPAMAMTKPTTQNARNRQSSPSSTSSVLVFSEPFRISIGSERDQGIEPYFLVPLEQCAKATLFNMGLIHYHWGNVETAMQFYDLASSLSQQLSPLAFDPVILGSFNNKAQILLQHYGRQSDAMEILQDALTRGNAALVTLYEREGITYDAATADADPALAGGWCARRLRRKLARTVMNLGHVYFVRCEYDAAMATCNDALRLLHANMEDMEICAVWHNMGLIHYYNSNNQQGGNSAANNNHDSYNSKTLALEYLNRFLDRAPAFIGNEHLQIAEALHIVGLIYFEGMGNLYQNSIQPLNEALRIRQSRLGANHALVAESLCVIGRLLQAREEYDFAIGALTNGIAILRGQGATDNASNCNHTNNTSAEKLTSVTLSFDGARALLELGRTLHAHGCLMDALSVYIEATEWSKHTFGQHVYVARLLNLVGNLHLETGHVDLAMECFSQAAHIFLQQEIPMVWNLVHDPLLHVHLAHHPAAPTA